MPKFPFALVLISMLTGPWSIIPAAAEPVCDYRIQPHTHVPLVLDVRVDCGENFKPHFRFVETVPDSALSELPSTDHVFHYRVNIDAITGSRRSPRHAIHINNHRYLTIGHWLALPRSVRNIRLKLDTSALGTYAPHTALERIDGEPTLMSRELHRGGYSIFSEQQPEVISVPGPGSLLEGRQTKADIRIMDLRPHGEPLRQWIEDSALAVSRYFGGFPVPELLIIAIDGKGTGIDYGRVVSGGGATMLLIIGENTRTRDLYGEWVLIHEMLHLGAPFTPGAFWFMEGFATYAEPIIRAREGWRSEKSVWNEFSRDMPRGGMYWSGATFMFLADLAYRRLSGGSKGLEHCMYRVLQDLGDTTVNQTVERVIRHCDQQFGSGVMANLLTRGQFRKPNEILPTVFNRLGVRRTTQGVGLSDAPESSLRESVLRKGLLGPVEINENAPDVFR